MLDIQFFFRNVRDWYLALSLGVLIAIDETKTKLVGNHVYSSL
ncbi:MAG: hypothetical protein QW723_02675 [Candidatus Bathyarchaeia archaeon]